MEDSGAEGDLNCGGPGQQVSEEKNITMWPRNQFCHILVKKKMSLCLKICLKLN